MSVRRAFGLRAGSSPSDRCEPVGSLGVVKVADQLREQRRFLDHESVSRTGQDRELTVWKRTVHSDRMLQFRLVTVSDYHERGHGEGCEVAHIQRRCNRVKSVELLDDHGPMVPPIG